jgi:ABC-2 type transport system ATP-binding protein
MVGEGPPALAAVAESETGREPGDRGPLVKAVGIEKRFGTKAALAGVDLAVAPGEVVGLLGPNGAGKTTLVRILSTLLRPDAGWASVAGHDVVRDPFGARRCLGLAGQYAALDEELSGRENLELVGRLYHLGPELARWRAAELLERMGVGEELADRPVRTYSGGMRRRVDLAAGLVLAPPVLFLDEPTTGLDPASRLELWALVEELASGGTAVLLTTQYLEEAARLANRVVVIDGGRVLAEGAPDELSRSIGGSRLEVTLAEESDLGRARAVLERLVGQRADPPVPGGVPRLVLPLAERRQVAPDALRALDDEGIAIVDLAVRQPTLDDVFVALTGAGATTSPGTPPGT